MRPGSAAVTAAAGCSPEVTVATAPSFRDKARRVVEALALRSGWAEEAEAEAALTPTAAQEASAVSVGAVGQGIPATAEHPHSRLPVLRSSGRQGARAL